jgi:hypothetical protein
MDNIRGGSVAQQLVHAVRGAHASPDAVPDAIRAARDGAWFRGLARELQKLIERGAPA